MKITTTDRKAHTIIAQISAQTRMACGWRDAFSFDGSNNNHGGDVIVRAKVLRANRLLEIALEHDDTYTVTLFKVPTMRAKSFDLVPLETHTDVYCDMLSDVVYHTCNK